MYKKPTYNKWLLQSKNFNSIAHYKKYLHSLSPSKLIWDDVNEYYKNQYEEWLIENFEEAK
ncbi:MAG: hypothetical protein H7Y18_03425 [Clostridiaceae bacterium]|nr:hypothetical protein [Clostridiaceae bacterium]